MSKKKSSQKNLKKINTLNLLKYSYASPKNQVLKSDNLSVCGTAHSLAPTDWVNIISDDQRSCCPEQSLATSDATTRPIVMKDTSAQFKQTGLRKRVNVKTLLSDRCVPLHEENLNCNEILSYISIDKPVRLLLQMPGHSISMQRELHIFFL